MCKKSVVLYQLWNRFPLKRENSKSIIQKAGNETTLSIMATSVIMASL